MRVSRISKQKKTNLSGVNMRKAMLSTTAIVAGVLMASTSAHAVDVNADWDHLNITRGTATVTDTGLGTTTIDQSSVRAIAEGDGINLGEDAHITINQASDNAFLAVIDIGDGTDPTQILGRIDANGGLLVIDSNGVFFGHDARIDVGSLITSTGAISADDFMDGDSSFKFSDFGRGEIVNHSKITVAEAGLAAFVSPFVKNTGVIKAKAGTVVVAAGETVTLDMYGDGLVEVAVEGELKDALIENHGEINAAGGVVNITAKAAKDTVDNIINNTGIITASSATVSGDKIILSGGDNGTINNSGVIRTSGEDGSINISGERFIQTPPKPGVKPRPPVIDEELEFEPEAFEDRQILAVRAAPEPTGPTINANGGDVTIQTSGDVEILAGTVDAGGGNINIDNAGTFYSAQENTLKTSDEGTISVRQNEGGKIQNAINAIDNNGSGNNIVKVGAGTYNEAVRADVENLKLKGANAGVLGTDIRGAESIIVPNSPGVFVVSDNVTVDGFTIVGGESGVRVYDADNADIKNNIIRDQYHGAGIGNSFGGFATGDGVFVQESEGTKITGNKIFGMNDDGIHAVDVENITVSGNFIHDTTGDGDEGIAIARATGTTIVDDNIVTGARRDGIQLHTVSGESFVTNNEIISSGNAGISIIDTDGVVVSVNKSSFSGGNGIDVRNSSDAVISNNGVAFSGDNGIELAGGADAEITGNNIAFAGDNAISVISNDGVSITQNSASLAADDGIRVQDSNNAVIAGNEVGGSGDDGIYVSGGFDVTIEDNIVGGAGGNAIKVISSAGASIIGNELSFAAGDGIDLSFSDAALIDDNMITFVGDDGIDVEYSDGAVISNNDIAFVDDDGIEVIGGGVVELTSNIVSDTGDDGIDVSEAGEVIINNNDIARVDDNGIEVTNTAYVEITENTITDAGDNGIYVAGSGGFIPLFRGQEVDERTAVARSAFYGPSFALIEGNDVKTSGGDGVQIVDLFEADVLDNTIENSAQHGLYVSGFANGFVGVQGNTFTDNGGVEFAQARFESGDIDVSDVTNPNIFIKTTDETGVAMQFDDISGFDIPSTDIPTDTFETAFIIDEIIDGPVGPFGTGLRIVEETLGATEFTGYTDAGNFYVRFEDGAILDPITRDPIIIDGTNASFDGIIPASFAGTTLPLATLQFIEDRLFDADDAVANERGQIFTGFVETIDGPANFQDFLPEFNPGAGLNNAASVTITSLPSIGNFGNTGGAAGLNDIAPAAGEESSDPQDLANIEPSAGDESEESSSVTCLGDAVNSLDNGSVTYNFGGTFEDTIAGASGCQSGGA